jgi:hypothetical protein
LFLSNHQRALFYCFFLKSSGSVLFTV